MTVAAPNNHPHVTDGEHVRGGVRASENATVTPIRPDIDPRTARTHAISRSPQPIKDNKRGKIRNFASTHTAEAKQSFADDWLGQDRPQNLTEVAKRIKTGNPIAVFRLAVYTLAYLICFAVDTNKRATVTFVLVTLSTLTAWAIAALAH